MVKLQHFFIPLPLAATGVDRVTYEINKSFFDLFAGSAIEDGQLEVDVLLEKTPRHVQLSFKIIGELKLVCDRSLDVFVHPINISQKVHFKLGSVYEELEADLYVISRQDTQIFLAQHIYDFISLDLPMKRLHPRFEAPVEV